MELKKKALVAVFATVAAVGALTGCDNHKSNTAQANPPAVTQTAPAPVAVQPQVVVQQPVAHKGDTPEEKQAKIDKMVASDRARMGTMGYQVLAQIGMGTANADFTDLKDAGWHGNSTSFQYSILLNSGQHAKVVVEHHNFAPTVHNPVLLQ
jgi:hypothetical protein